MGIKRIELVKSVLAMLYLFTLEKKKGEKVKSGTEENHSSKSIVFTCIASLVRPWEKPITCTGVLILIKPALSYDPPSRIWGYI